MGGKKLTNLANGVSPQDAVTFLQVFTDPVFVATTAEGFKVTGSMFKALTTTIQLVASGALTLTCGTVCDFTAQTLNITASTLLNMADSAAASLPANTTIGTLTATELGYLKGVTSPIQAQFAAISANIQSAVVAAVAPWAGQYQAGAPWTTLTAGEPIQIGDVVSQPGTGNSTGQARRTRRAR